MSLSGKPCASKIGLTLSHLSPAAFTVVVATASVATAAIHKVIILGILAAATSSSSCSFRARKRNEERDARYREAEKGRERRAHATISALLLATAACCRRRRRRDGRDDTYATPAFARARVSSSRAARPAGYSPSWHRSRNGRANRGFTVSQDTLQNKFRPLRRRETH